MTIWPKTFRDPIHGLIQFEDEVTDHLLLDLINTREFQRMRRIKQLGLSELVYPGASHTRFSHSIGVMHVSRMFLSQLAKVRSGGLPDDWKLIVPTTALLHDVGHGPFSHAFERATGEKHEARLMEILRDDSTEVHRELSKVSADLPERIVTFLNEETLPTQIISSQLDADRFDYLLRDGHATGTKYGNLDLFWMINNLYLDEDRQRFYMGRKALEATESYLFARYHMYRTVYFHKATRAAEVMLKLIFRRYKTLINASASEADRRAHAPDAPPAIVRAFSGAISLADYLLLDDHAMTEFLKACENSPDQILKQLGSGLLHRHMYKCVDATDAAPENHAPFGARVGQLIQDRKLDFEYSLVGDTAADTPYKPYDPGEDHPATQIYIEKSTGECVEISDYSEPIARLRRRYSLIRYYFPESLRAEIDTIARETLMGRGE